MFNTRESREVIACSKIMLTELRGIEVSWGAAMADLFISQRDKDALMGGLLEAKRHYGTFVNVDIINTPERALDIYELITAYGGREAQVAGYLKRFCREDGLLSLTYQKALKEHSAKYGWLLEMKFFPSLMEKIYWKTRPSEDLV